MEEVESECDLRTRTLDVTLQGGAPWGFSVKGGSEHRCPLTIARVRILIIAGDALQFV